MQSILSIAVSGLNNAAARLANAASSIVNASSTSAPSSTGQSAAQNHTGLMPQDAVSISNPNVDLNSELIASKEDQISYSADAKLIKVSREMDQSLLDAIS